MNTSSATQDIRSLLASYPRTTPIGTLMRDTRVQYTSRYENMEHTHLPSTGQEDVSHSLTSTEQSLAPYCTGQMHDTPKTPSTHVPPFWHDCEVQSSMLLSHRVPVDARTLLDTCVSEAQLSVYMRVALKVCVCGCVYACVCMGCACVRVRSHVA